MAASSDNEVVIKSLRSGIKGEVITPEHPEYDTARRVWNGVIDRHPAVIARVTDTADVVEVLAIARQHDIELSIRSGGHQVAGSGVIDDGLVIDLSTMRDVVVDPEARTARVAAGARWGDVDRATQEHGLATTGGEVSITGVAGLTLGGGMGLLHRAFGLAADNLRSIEIVTADGVVRTASAAEHTDLFWAAKGAGRGLGVVTSFEFDLQPLGPEVTAAWKVFPADDARRVTRAYRDLVLASPETVSPELMFWGVPPDPAIPEELHGQPVVMVIGLYAGDPADAGPALAPFEDLGEPLLDLGVTMPYADLQASPDPLFPEGDRYYMKSHFADDLGEEAIDALVTSFEKRLTPETLIAVRSLGGAIDRVSPNESAYPHRGHRFNLSYDAAWTDPHDDAELVGWARDSFTASRQYGAGGVYTNFAGFEGEADVSTADRLGTEARLAEIRAAYDPEGLFAAAAARP